MKRNSIENRTDFLDKVENDNQASLLFDLLFDIARADALQSIGEEAQELFRYHRRGNPLLFYLCLIIFCLIIWDY